MVRTRWRYPGEKQPGVPVHIISFPDCICYPGFSSEVRYQPLTEPEHRHCFSPDVDRGVYPTMASDNIIQDINPPDKPPGPSAADMQNITATRLSDRKESLLYRTKSSCCPVVFRARP